MSRSVALSTRRITKVPRVSYEQVVCINDVFCDDMLMQIFAFLNGPHQIVAQRTCRRWRTLIKKTHQLMHADDTIPRASLFSPPHSLLF